MNKSDVVLTLIIIIVLTALTLAQTKENIVASQQIAEELKHAKIENMAVIGTMEHLIKTGRYERVANLRKIEQLIMLGGYSELKRTDT